MRSCPGAGTPQSGLPQTLTGRSEARSVPITIDDQPFNPPCVARRQQAGWTESVLALTSLTFDLPLPNERRACCVTYRESRHLITSKARRSMLFRTDAVRLLLRSISHVAFQKLCPITFRKFWRHTLMNNIRGNACLTPTPVSPFGAVLHCPHGMHGRNVGERGRASCSPNGTGGLGAKGRGPDARRLRPRRLTRSRHLRCTCPR